MQSRFSSSHRFSTPLTNAELNSRKDHSHSHSHSQSDQPKPTAAATDTDTGSGSGLCVWSHYHQLDQDENLIKEDQKQLFGSQIGEYSEKTKSTVSNHHRKQ